MDTSIVSFDSYVGDVEVEQRKAHKSSVRLLAIYRLARAAGLIAAAITPILAATHAGSAFTASVAAFAAVAIGLVQVTAMQELATLDRDRADSLQHEIRGYLNSKGSYEHATARSDLFFERVEAIRLDWQRRRRRLVRSTFRTIAATDSEEGGGGIGAHRRRTALTLGVEETDRQRLIHAGAADETRSAIAR